MSLHGFVSKSGIAAQPSVPERAGRAVRSRRIRPGVDGVGRSAAVPPSRTEMAAAASRAWTASSGMRRGVSRKAGPQMSTAAITLPRASWTGRRDRVEPELVLADGRRVAAPPDPGELLEERLELDDRPLRVADQAAADDPQDLALGERRQQDLAGRDAVERRGPPGPVADRDEVRAVDLGDGQQRVAVEDAETGRLVGQPGEPFELGQGDPRAGRASARRARRAG